MQKIIAIILLTICSFGLYAQHEQLVPLTENDILSKYSWSNKHSTSRIAPLILPVFDDFNYTGPFADPQIWIDSFAYVNNHYPILPPSIGVATFDGLNANGKPYSLLEVNAVADYLTSQPILLNGLTSDSLVFLSFMYQPMGLGQRPEANQDFLMLEFKDQTDNWIEQWRTTGDSSRAFKQVFIPLSNDFLYDGFQFRFKNIAKISGNNDHFHVDYVVLDKNRDTIQEQSPKDMAFQSIPTPLLKTYYAMPYNQFDSTYLADQVTIQVRNNFTNATTDFLDNYESKELATSTTLSSYIGSSVDLAPTSDNTFNYLKFNVPSTFSGDTITIRTTYSFNVSAEAGADPKVLANNTVVKDQVFANFFSYDDGTAERGYRLTDVTGGQVALKFDAKTLDTLQGIKVHFANLNRDYSLSLLSVLVWKQIGATDEILYKEDLVKLSDFRKPGGVDALNDFAFYDLKKQFILDGSDKLLVQGTFYIGFLFTDKDKWTIGYDLNTDGSQNMFYNVGNGWAQTQFQGSLMVNPILGKPLPWELTPVIQPKQTLTFKIYPNPAKNQFFIEGIQHESMVNIYNSMGSLVYSEQIAESKTIDIQKLTTGLYFIEIEDLQLHQKGSSKLIIR